MDHLRHQASPVAIDLIKRFEGYRRDAAQLPDGRWTVGHGHTLSAREGASVSEEDAEDLLIYDLRAVAEAIDAAVYTPLTQNQFDALVSFAFNIGVENFRRSAVLRRINAGALLEAAFALEAWRKADFEGERIVVDALVRRRAAEKALFLTPQDGFVPTPSPLVEPKIDLGLDLAAPAAPAADQDELVAQPAAPVEDELSPSERAAANLAARLRLLVPEEPAAPEPAAEPEPVGEPEPFPTVAPAARVEPPAEPAPFATIPPPAPPPPGNVEALRRAIFGHPEPQAAPAERNGFWPLALLAGVGMLVFIGAIVWAFHAKPAGGGSAPPNLGVIVIGVIGILCVASAVYFLLERLAGRDP